MKSSKNLVEFEKNAALAATGSDKPYAAMIKYAGLAALDGSFTANDRDKFYAKLTAAKPTAIKTHTTLIDSRKSEAWSCVKLAFEFKHCAADLFANMEKATPTPTGIYDIACAIRAKAQFAKGKPCEKKAITLHETSAVAPTVEKMQAAITASNSYRNNLSGAAPKTFAEFVKATRERFEKYRDGKVIARDAKTGEVIRDKEKNPVKLPGDKSDVLGNVIAALAKLESAHAPAVKANGRKPRLVVNNKAA
jgi:hypothetical protein